MRRRDCDRCRRPEGSCLCPFLAPVDTGIEVVFLQHAREAKRRIGTAWLAHLALPSSRFLVGIEFEDRADFAALLDRPGAYLLFPGPEARRLGEGASPGRPTLFVPDGTWSQARRVLRGNPRLAALPRLRVEPRGPSRFLLRRPPKPDLRSTLEAVVDALVALEGRPERFEKLLGALDALVSERDLRRSTNEVGPRRRARPRMRN